MQIKVIEVTDLLVLFELTWQDQNTRFSCDRNAFPKDTQMGDLFYHIEHHIFDQYRNQTMVGGLCLRWANIQTSVKKLD